MIEFGHKVDLVSEVIVTRSPDPVRLLGTLKCGRHLKYVAIFRPYQEVMSVR